MKRKSPDFIILMIMKKQDPSFIINSLFVQFHRLQKHFISGSRDTEAFHTLSLRNILLYNNIFDVLNRMLRNQAVIRLCSRRSFALFQMEGDFFSDGKKCSYSE